MNNHNKFNDRNHVQSKIDEAMIPGFIAEFDPSDALVAGAFSEDALTFIEALESSMDNDPDNLDMQGEHNA